ncbi:hypothetical protein KAZ93_00810 [Patescibacteria group bacterium]|nr:hypothetical protein [Patescibacteria group bacterium]
MSLGDRILGGCLLSGDAVVSAESGSDTGIVGVVDIQCISCFLESCIDLFECFGEGIRRQDSHRPPITIKSHDLERGR